MSGLKNYTSQVAHEKSIAHIESRLVKIGARKIQKEYTPDGFPIALIFDLPATDEPGGTMIPFKLSAKVEQCFQVLRKMRKRNNTESDQRDLKQAHMTGWKIISDWVDIMATMILLEQAEKLELFLPHWYDPKTEKTFYEVAKANNFKKLLSA